MIHESSANSHYTGTDDVAWVDTRATAELTLLVQGSAPELAQGLLPAPELAQGSAQGLLPVPELAQGLLPVPELAQGSALGWPWAPVWESLR